LIFRFTQARRGTIGRKDIYKDEHWSILRVTTIRARQLRKNSTDAERLLWRALRSRQLHGYKFRRQQSLGPFIVDFVCLEARLVIELDGGQHNEEKQAVHDAERNVWLRKEGFQVLRFWDHEVLKQLDVVKDAIGKALGGD
jgi:very-short-patch-repair endonuclease